MSWTSAFPWNVIQFSTYLLLIPQLATPSLDRNNLPHLQSSSTTALNSRLKRYLTWNLSAKLWNMLFTRLVTTNLPGNPRNSWKTPPNWFTNFTERLNQTLTWLPASTMTRSRISSSETSDNLIIHSDSEEVPEDSQQLTPKEEATVMNPPLPTPAPLMLLLVAYLAWSLELE